MTLDGQLTLPGEHKKFAGKPAKHEHSNWITSEESRAEVHRMRHASDALLTGIGTIRADDPLLTDRSGLSRRRPLLRVVLDFGLSLSLSSRIVKTVDNEVLVFTNQALGAQRARILQKLGVEVLPARSLGGRINLQAVLAELGRREILSVILEAGPTLNGAALAAGIVHKLVLFYAPKIAGENRVPFAIAPKLLLPPLQRQTVRQFGPDIAIVGYLQDVYRTH
jgi:diaminohydroxyphosphoribosylaminopyrimidine deaminase/5-amino-6-(5-phosphoribosylamino)uracil reductase